MILCMYSVSKLVRCVSRGFAVFRTGDRFSMKSSACLSYIIPQLQSQSPHHIHISSPSPSFNQISTMAAPICSYTSYLTIRNDLGAQLTRKSFSTTEGTLVGTWPVTIPPGETSATVQILANNGKGNYVPADCNQEFDGLSIYRQHWLRGIRCLSDNDWPEHG